MDVAVVGQVAQDLVLLVEDLREPGRSVQVREQRETLGGKGANQAVSLAEVHVVDTTGAGDAFTAALTLALLRGAEPADAAQGTAQRAYPRWLLALGPEAARGFASARNPKLRDVARAVVAGHTGAQDCSVVLPRPRPPHGATQATVTTVLELDPGCRRRAPSNLDYVTGWVILSISIRR
jgi:sugar/nucleoside kinase (ribokinase family)